MGYNPPSTHHQMTEFSNKVIPSLPPTITGDGLYPVNVVVPNIGATLTTGNFAPTVANPSTSYSYPLMDPAKLIGTGSQPYMNVGLPAYIATLYNNVYNINSKLVNNITATATDDREYPTSFAVQAYVQLQLTGTQNIDGANNTYHVLTTVNNTVIKTGGLSSAVGFQYVSGTNTKNISLYWMETGVNEVRNGATKTVMFTDPDYLSVNDVPTGALAFLYAGDSSYFTNHGERYKYYQFVIHGDFVDFVQVYTPAVAANGNIPATPAYWSWMVKDSTGVFANDVRVCDANNASINISKVEGNTMPYPLFGIAQ